MKNTNNLNIKLIKGDAFGGIFARNRSFTHIALAFGVSYSLGASAGLYGAIFISFFAAFFGGTNTQISGPTAPMTAVSMVIIAGIVAANDNSNRKSFTIHFDGVFIGDLTAERSELDTLKEEAWPDEIDFPKNLKGEVFIKHIKGPLFFGSTSEFQQLYKQIPEGAKTVVIRLSRIQYMDQSGLYVMEDTLQDLKAKGVDVIFVGLLKQPRYMMERIDIIPDFIPEEHIYQSFKAYLSSLSK